MAKGLGKGINALFNNIEAEQGEVVNEISLKELRPNPYQPRKVFSEEAIEELKAINSITRNFTAYNCS